MSEPRPVLPKYQLMQALLEACGVNTDSVRNVRFESGVDHPMTVLTVEYLVRKTDVDGFLRATGDRVTRKFMVIPMNDSEIDVTSIRSNSKEFVVKQPPTDAVGTDGCKATVSR